ncbi:MAG TPA: class I SAM-dependent methyltransferase [Acetobacteraceae bacterium]|nr:class I SAM-dependent methyltransferase [Acetobacteraceae bacterium]
MNAVLRQILATGTVTDGSSTFPLIDQMDRSEGALIDHVFRTVKPSVSIEIGCAYGISAMYACDALSANGVRARHIILDPFQSEAYHGIGLRNLREAGYSDYIELNEERSEIMLPRLHDDGVKVQAAIIDGMHTFDHALVDFFYVNKLLDVGGVIIFDDVHMPALRRLVRHVLTYPAYSAFATNRDFMRPATMKTKVRRFVAPFIPKLRRHWDVTSCSAVKKIGQDTRPWDWFAEF